MLRNAHVRVRFWQAASSMDASRAQRRRRRSAVRAPGRGRAVSATTAISRSLPATTSSSRAARCGASSAQQPLAALLIEATNASYTLPDKGLRRHARDLRSGHARHAAHRRRLPRPAERRRAVAGARSSAATRSRPSPIRSIRSTRWAGTAICRWCASTCSDIRPLMSHRYHLPPSAHTTFVADRFVVCTFVPRPFETDPGRAQGAVLPQQRRLRRSDLLSRGQFLLPRQHPPGHDHAASRAASRMGRIRRR